MMDILNVSLAREYFDKTDREIDHDETGKAGLIPIDKADLLQNILTTEVSIYLLRRNIGFCGSLVDDMANIRRRLIDNYELDFEPYIEYNDFY